MGTMTINVQDETIARFRTAVQAELGTGKGKLGKAVEDALRKWVEEREQQKIAQRQLALMERGFSGKKWKFNREELYDRKY